MLKSDLPVGKQIEVHDWNPEASILAPVVFLGLQA